ncbi:hypothetical protein JCM30566_06420 [Marinitoga arctica]
MRKILIPVLLLIIILSSCFSQNKKVEITIEGDIVSPSFPIKIDVNIENYELKFFDKNNVEINYEKNGDEYYLLDLNEGENEIYVHVYSEKKKIFEKEIKVFYDSIPPEIAFLNYYLRGGILNITASSPATDLRMFVLEDKGKRYEFNINLKIPIEKNKGIIEYKLYAIDKYNNISKPKIIRLNTNEDKKPTIINNDLIVSLFGKTNIQAIDDWTPSDHLRIYLKTENNSYSLINIDEVLLENSKEGTLVVFDNGNNFTEKRVKIEVEKNIPSIATGNPRLIDFSVDTFGWNYETDVESYVVEIPYDYGWEAELDTKAAYARVTDSKIAMIRKKNKFGTLSFPSYPTIRFSGTFVHLVRNILESSEDNLYLPQINSEFLIGGQTVLGEKSIVMVESGSTLKFVSNSKLIIKGLFFIMPGAGKSLISGNGEIIVDGGIFIASKTIFDKVRIIGNNAKLIYLEDSEFLNDSDLFSSNDYRICLYNTLGYKSTINLYNTEEVYIKESSFKDLNLQNVSMLNTSKSFFVNINLSNLSKMFLNQTNVKNIIQKGFSWSKMMKSTIDKMDISDYSRSILYETRVGTITENTSVVVK